MTANQVGSNYRARCRNSVSTTTTSSGATAFRLEEANLSLKVKPQITPDGKVTMTLDVNKGHAEYLSLSTGSGVAIDTKHVKTEVLVDNGGTVVIGGIYTQKKSDTTYRVPFFGDLPIHRMAVQESGMG